MRMSVQKLNFAFTFFQNGILVPNFAFLDDIYRQEEDSPTIFQQAKISGGLIAIFCSLPSCH